jgi:hypothetical protein
MYKMNCYAHLYTLKLYLSTVDYLSRSVFIELVTAIYTITTPAAAHI